MAIRVEHNFGGTAAMAGFAAGQGKSRERKSKYFTALMQDTARMRARYGAIGARRGGGAIEAPKGHWKDPLDTLDVIDPVHGRAARKGRDRKRRLGKDLPSEWKPIWVPDPTKDEIRAKEREEEHQWDLDKDNRANDRARRSRISSNLPSIPEHITDPAKRRLFQQKRSAIERLLESVDFADPTGAGLESLNAEIDAYNNMIADNPEPDAGEAYNKSTRYRDADGVLHKDPGEGREPGRVGGDGMFVPDNAEAKKKEAVAAEKEAEKKAKADASRQKEISDLRTKIATEKGKESENQNSELLSELQRQLDALGDDTMPSRGGMGVPPVEVKVKPDGSAEVPAAETPAGGLPRTSTGGVDFTGVDVEVVPEPLARPERISPDGKHRWNGSEWIPVGGA